MPLQNTHTHAHTRRKLNGLIIHITLGYPIHFLWDWSSSSSQCLFFEGRLLLSCRHIYTFAHQFVTLLLQQKKLGNIFRFIKTDEKSKKLTRSFCLKLLTVITWLHRNVKSSIKFYCSINMRSSRSVPSEVWMNAAHLSQVQTNITGCKLRILHQLDEVTLMVSLLSHCTYW